MKHVKSTTTSSLQNMDIEEYLDPISVSIVVDMNSFKDVQPNFSETSGLKSNNFSKSLGKINQQAISELKKSAQNLRADYVIGTTVSREEIIVQKKTMLLVTAMGTAVKVAEHDSVAQNSPSSIDIETFKEIELKAEILKNVENHKLELNQTNWDLIIENQISELSPYFLEKLTDTPNLTILKENLRLFFKNIDEDIATSEIFKFIQNNEEKDLTPVIDIVKELNLIDYHKNISLLTNESEKLNEIGVSIAEFHKKTYYNSDIGGIRENLETLESKYPVTAEFYESMDNLTRKEIQVWKCECGTENSLEREKCRDCNKDIHGFKNAPFNLKEIKGKLKQRLDILENTLG